MILNKEYIKSLKKLEGNDFFDSFEIKQKLGIGQSYVYEAYNQQKNQYAAVKQIIVQDDHTLKVVQDEIKILKFLKINTHEHIIQYIDHFIGVQEGNNIKVVFILMEKAQLSLRDYIEDLKKKQQRIDKDLFFQIFLQLTGALYFLQQQEIHHGDIKPENILIMSLKPIKVKIADLGCSSFHTSKEASLPQKGTIQFMSPELVYKQYQSNYNENQLVLYQKLFQNHKNPFKSDVFSLGLVLIFMTNQEKFKTESRKKLSLEIQKEILDDQIMKIKKYISTIQDEIINFIKRMITINQLSRPDFKDTQKFCLDIKNAYFKEQYYLPLPPKSLQKRRGTNLNTLQNNSINNNSTNLTGQDLKMQLPKIKNDSQSMFLTPIKKLRKSIRNSMDRQNQSLMEQNNSPNKSIGKIIKQHQKNFPSNYDWVILDKKFENQDYFPVSILNMIIKDKVTPFFFDYFKKINKLNQLNIIIQDFELDENIEFKFIEQLSKIILLCNSIGIKYDSNKNYLIENIIPQNNNIETIYLYPTQKNIDIKIKNILDELPNLKTIYLNNNVQNLPKIPKIKQIYFESKIECELSNSIEYLKLDFDEQFNDFQGNLKFLHTSVKKQFYKKFCLFLEKQSNLENLLIHFDKEIPDISKFNKIIQTLINLQQLIIIYENYDQQTLEFLQQIQIYNKIQTLTLVTNYFSTQKQINQINKFNTLKTMNYYILNQNNIVIQKNSYCTKLKSFFQPIQDLYICGCKAFVCWGCRKNHKNCEHGTLPIGMGYVNCGQNSYEYINTMISKIIQNQQEKSS